MTVTMLGGLPQAAPSASPWAAEHNNPFRSAAVTIDDQTAQEALHLDPVFAAGYAAGAAEAAKLAKTQPNFSSTYADVNSRPGTLGPSSLPWGTELPPTAAAATAPSQYHFPPASNGFAERPPRFPHAMGAPPARAPGAVATAAAAAVGKGKAKGAGFKGGLQTLRDVGADQFQQFSYQGQEQGPASYVPHQSAGGIATRNPEPATMQMQMPSGNLSQYHRNYFVRPTGVSPNTWRVHGELISRGAKNHPHNCVPCKFYCHGAGCLSGPNCGFCHEFHVSKSKFHAQRRAKGKGKGSAGDVQGLNNMWDAATKNNPAPAPSSTESYCQPTVCLEAPLSPAERVLSQPERVLSPAEGSVNSRSMPAPAPTATTVPESPQDWLAASGDEPPSPSLW